MPPSTTGGAFHVSTADYLRFADGARFFASPSQPSVLTFADHPGIGIDAEICGQASVINGSEVAASSFGSGRPAGIRIVAGGLEVAGDLTTGFFSAIASRAFSSGAAGNIDITADSVLLRNRAVTNTRAWAPAAAAISWYGAGRSSCSTAAGRPSSRPARSARGTPET